MSAAGRRAAILYLGRPSASGEARRVATWHGLLEANGVAVTAIPLLVEHPGPRPPRARDLARLCTGNVVPEALAWSWTSVGRRLEGIPAGAVIFVTARAFHPALVRHADIAILDFVNSLARSYRDRAGLSTRVRRPAFSALSAAHRRFETRAIPGVHRTASGWRDARELGAEWLPEHIPTPQTRRSREPQRDVLFFGNLAYPPNVAAVRRMSRIWPALQRRRPGTTALIAGATPLPEVRSLADIHGWDLIANFADLQDLCDQARLAIAPLDHTAGIQTKVLEAAAMRLAQVVTPPALEGMAPGFPATVAVGDYALVAEICRLLDDPAARATEALAAQRHVTDTYAIDRWAPTVGRLLRPG